MAAPDPLLADLAVAYGIATEFWDWQGRQTSVPPETLVAVLAALGVDARSPDAVAAAREERELAPWRRRLPPVTVARHGEDASLVLHVPTGSAVNVRLDLEDGSSRAGLSDTVGRGGATRTVDGRAVQQVVLRLPNDLPLGYHTVRVDIGGDDARAALIVTPDRLEPPRRLGSRRVWGLATQLYSVRSRDSWGVGDLTDLTDLAVWSAVEHGAGFVLVNPLHAAEPVGPMQPSPYLPASRRFTNPMYLRVQAIPEYARLDATARERVDALHRDVHDRLAEVDRIDRDTAWTAQREALAVVAAHRRSPGREIAFRAYCRREGTGLDDYATWCVLVERYGPDPATWPSGFERPDAAAVPALRKQAADALDFHRWLQWQLDEQLSAAQASAVDAGMALGVMHDLAVGVSPTGADAWRLADVFASAVSVGAPPDAFNQSGQDWGQPPWRPDRLEELAYAPLRELVAAVLRHAGGLRVDHILGLFRLWWIPAGASAMAGTYVRYDHDAMIGILALEAHRADAVVVGEDLGTVEPWVRDYLHQRGVLGTSILWFERHYDGDGSPRPPEEWRADSLASVTTHDLPPTTGYLAGDHVRLREALSVLTRPLAEELAADEADRASWLHELRARGLLSEDPDVAATVLALHRFLTLTPARLLGVALTDAVGDRRTQNQPGTRDEYPNWRVPLTGPDGHAIWLEDVFTDPAAARLLDQMARGLATDPRPRPATSGAGGPSPPG
ncbi:MAG: 4-alpha-glucanotransferase [bacterium]